ncbi:MAG: DUF4012 domain-containing protein [Acidimicrobiia bacterium]
MRYRRGFTRHKVAILIGAGVFTLLVLIGVDLYTARSGVTSARNHVGSAVEMIHDGRLDRARMELGAAVEDLAAVRNRLRSPWVSIARVVPFAGTEIRAGAGGVDAVSETAEAALDILDFVLDDRSPLFAEGRISAESVGLLRASLRRAEEHVTAARKAIIRVPRPRLRSISEALGDIDDASAALLEVLTGVVPLVDDVYEAAAGGDPFRLLVFFENEAELRGTGGIMGFAGVFEIADGNVALIRAEGMPTLGRSDTEGGFLAVAAPDDYIRRYGGFQANTALWSNVNLSPDFPTVADIAGRLYEKVTGVHAQLIARIDLVGLGYLLDAFTGINVDGEPLMADTLATDFVIDSYARSTGQSAYLAAVVVDVFDQVLGGADAERTVLLRAVDRAFRERRLALASPDDATDEALRVSGAAGGLLPGDPGDVEVVVQNFAANKIDIYTQATISVMLQPTGCFMDGELDVELSFDLPTALEGMPQGYFGNLGRWWTSFYLPRNAEIVHLAVDGEPAGGTTDVELGRTVASVLMEAESGGEVSAKVLWREQLYGPNYTLRMQPQPMVAPAMLSVGAESSRAFVEMREIPIPTDCEL